MSKSPKRVGSDARASSVTGCAGCRIDPPAEGTDANVSRDGARPGRRAAGRAAWRGTLHAALLGSNILYPKAASPLPPLAVMIQKPPGSLPRQAVSVWL